MENIEKVLSIIIVFNLMLKKKKFLYIQASTHQKHHAQPLVSKNFMLQKSCLTLNNNVYLNCTINNY